MNEISAIIEETPESPFVLFPSCEDIVRRWLFIKQGVLRISNLLVPQFLDFSASHNCEKYMFVVYKAPSL